VKPVLLDSGCVVALVDKSEKHHKQCVDVITSLTAPLVTCEAVITECCYLVRNLPGAATAILENVESGEFQVTYRLSDEPSRVVALIQKYKSVPMDLADACLVDMAHLFQTGQILTLDSDFQIYRWDRNRRFDMLIDIDR